MQRFGHRQAASALLLVSLLAGSTLAVVPLARAATAATGLHVSGNQIVDAGGAAVRLIGVNRSGTEYRCIQGYGIFEGPSDAASVQAIADWHTNAVRIPLNEDCWLGINGAPAAYSGANYRNAIADYIALLETHGLIPVLELHWSAAGTSPATGQQPMPNRDHTPAFWSNVADTFKNDTGVIFDLFNEPFPDGNRDTTAAWTCWRDGGACQGVSFTAAGMQELVDAVRTTGATNIILLSGVRYANAMSRWLTYKPVDATGNLAASWHAYNFNACKTVACWDLEVAPLLDAVPLVAGEIGQDGCGSAFVDLVMGWLDGHRTGYLPWAWDTNFGCFSLITDFGGTPTQPYGAAVRNHLATLRTLAGESVLGLGSFQVGPGSICNPDGSGIINFSATGTSTGPFPGSLTQTGTVSLGPTPPQQGGITFHAPVTAFDSTFTIVAGSTTITGSETLGTPEDTLPFGFFDLVSVGECLGGPFTTNQFGIGIRYSATITAPDGVSADTGFGHAFGAENRFISPSNLVEEEFSSFRGATPPDLPTNVIAAAGDGSATVTWLAPASNGGNPVRNYTVTSSPGGKSATSCPVFLIGAVERISLGSDATCHGTSATVTGLTNGISYTFKVTATNALGTGQGSTASDAVTPTPLAGATPTGTNVVVAPAYAGGTSPVGLTFGSVTTSGTSSLTTSTTGPAVPTGYQLGSPATYYDLQTTASYTGTITVCISYAGITPAPTQLLHYEGGVWKDITVLPVDTAAQRICGTTTSLSPFALVTTPALTIPPKILTTATGASGAVVSYSASAADAAGRPVSPVCSPASGSTFPVGTTTVTCTVTDTVGHTASRSFPVTVGYRFAGFAQPLNDPISATNPMSVFKGGSTIPVKFALTYANGTPISDPTAAAIATACGATISLAQTAGSAPPIDEAITSPTPNTGTCFRYDTTAHQFVFNLGTTGLPAPAQYALKASIVGPAIVAPSQTLQPTHSLAIGLR